MKKIIKKTVATTLSIFGILSAMPSAFCAQVKEDYNLGRYFKISSSDDLVVGKDNKLRDRTSSSKNIQPLFFLEGSFDVFQFKKILVDNKIINNKDGKLSSKWECKLELSGGDSGKGYSVEFKSKNKKIVFLFNPNKTGKLSESDYNFLLACFCELKGIIMPFSNNDLIIPGCVAKIDDDAFNANANLKNISIPITVKSIGNSAFALCTELEKVYIQSSVVSIGDRAFALCVKLKEIYIPNSVKSIGEHVFDGCNDLKRIYFNGKIYDNVESFMKDFNFKK